MTHVAAAIFCGGLEATARREGRRVMAIFATAAGLSVDPAGRWLYHPPAGHGPAGFNPTMVRLGQKERRRQEVAAWVSIPLWCD